MNRATSNAQFHWPEMKARNTSVVQFLHLPRRRTPVENGTVQYTRKASNVEEYLNAL